MNPIPFYGGINGGINLHGFKFMHAAEKLTIFLRMLLQKEHLLSLQMCQLGGTGWDRRSVANIHVYV
jgi:hypothetical protein